MGLSDQHCIRTYSGLKFYQLLSDLEGQEIVLGQDLCSAVDLAGEFSGRVDTWESQERGGEGEGGVDWSHCYNKVFSPCEREVRRRE